MKSLTPHRDAAEQALRGLDDLLARDVPAERHVRLGCELQKHMILYLADSLDMGQQPGAVVTEVIAALSAAVCSVSASLAPSDAEEAANLFCDSLRRVAVERLRLGAADSKAVVEDVPMIINQRRH
jgi:hypothetical protein